LKKVRETVTPAADEKNERDGELLRETGGQVKDVRHAASQEPSVRGGAQVKPSARRFQEDAS
jgi:hypothetical protein